MTRFAERTGLTSDRAPRRYLWTDAFAVCNFLELARATGAERYTELALQLIDEVHNVLGRHREDDSRAGWISGLDEAEGPRHPTRGGLRIGKPLPERHPADPADERLEWDRDGQYFHYLTQWMHALDQAARSTARSELNLWARELAEVAHSAFTYSVGARGNRRMVWKTSIDLTRPLVPSMGHHDPLDGLIACLQLEATATAWADPPRGPDLRAAAADFAAMAGAGQWATTDPLGLGGLLSGACRVAQLPKSESNHVLLAALLEAATIGLSHYAESNDLDQPPSRRLAFRELGLAIGLSGVQLIDLASRTRGQEEGSSGPYAESRNESEALARHVSLGAAIRRFWLEPDSRRVRTWSEHEDINDVMLATALLPDGYLRLHPRS